MEPDHTLPSPLDTPEIETPNAAAAEPKPAAPLPDPKPVPRSPVPLPFTPAPSRFPTLKPRGLEAVDTTPTPLTAAGKKKASYGALISIVIIMAIVVVGAFYAWGQRIHDQGGLEPANTAATSAASTTQTY